MNVNATAAELRAMAAQKAVGRERGNQRSQRSDSRWFPATHSTLHMLLSVRRRRGTRVPAVLGSDTGTMSSAAFALDSVTVVRFLAVCRTASSDDADLQSLDSLDNGHV